MRIFTALKNNYGKYLARAAGLGAVGLVGYDAHVAGKLNADTYSQTKKADYAAAAATNAMYLSEPSITQSKIKEKLSQLQMESNVGTIFNSTMGYFRGAGGMMVQNVVTLGLGLLALLAKNKPVVKWCGAGVVAIGAIKFVRDVCGLGQKSPLNSRF